MGNSLQTFALIREILYSHSPLKREILVNMSQKIAKFQTNAGASNGRSQANIWGVFGSRKTNICVDSAGLNETPHPGGKKTKMHPERSTRLPTAHCPLTPET
jgi:hypothetical protein